MVGYSGGDEKSFLDEYIILNLYIKVFKMALLLLLKLR